MEGGWGKHKYLEGGGIERGSHRNLAAPRGGAPLRKRLDHNAGIGAVAGVGAIEDAVLEDMGGGDIGSREDVGDGGVGSGGCAGPGEEYADARVTCTEGAWVLGVGGRGSHPTPYTLHPTPYALHPTPYALHPSPFTLHPTPYTLHPRRLYGLVGRQEGQADKMQKALPRS